MRYKPMSHECEQRAAMAYCIPIPTMRFKNCWCGNNILTQRAKAPFVDFKDSRIKGKRGDHKSQPPTSALGVPHPQIADPFPPHRHRFPRVQRQVVAVAVGQHGVKEHPAALGGAHPQATPAVGLGKRGGPTLLGGGNVQEQGQEPLVHHAGVAEVVVGLVLLAWVVPFCE